MRRYGIRILRRAEDASAGGQNFTSLKRQRRALLPSLALQACVGNSWPLAVSPLRASARAGGQNFTSVKRQRRALLPSLALQACVGNSWPLAVSPLRASERKCAHASIPQNQAATRLYADRAGEEKGHCWLFEKTTSNVRNPDHTSAVRRYAYDLVPRGERERDHRHSTVAGCGRRRCPGIRRTRPVADHVCRKGRRLNRS